MLKWSYQSLVDNFSPESIVLLLRGNNIATSHHSVLISYSKIKSCDGVNTTTVSKSIYNKWHHRYQIPLQNMHDINAFITVSGELRDSPSLVWSTDCQAPDKLALCSLVSREIQSKSQ